jgi:hypothetical protein
MVITARIWSLFKNILKSAKHFNIDKNVCDTGVQISLLYLTSDRLQVKVNVKMSLCSSLTEHHAMKTYWGWSYSSTHS